MTEDCAACSVKTVVEETEYIDLVQSIIEYGNAHVLHSFKVRLLMDEGEGDQGGLT